MSVNQELDEMKTKLAVLTERVESWLNTTTEYRKSLCAKVDNITSRLSDLPCKERRAFYDNAAVQFRLLWSLVIIVIGAIVAQWLVVPK